MAFKSSRQYNGIMRILNRILSVLALFVSFCIFIFCKLLLSLTPHSFSLFRSHSFTFPTSPATGRCWDYFCSVLLARGVFLLLYFKQPRLTLHLSLLPHHSHFYTFNYCNFARDYIDLFTPTKKHSAYSGCIWTCFLAQHQKRNVIMNLPSFESHYKSQHQQQIATNYR